MRRKLGITVLGVLLGITIAGVARADDDEKDDKNGRTILAFSTMYGVDGPFLNSTQVRGVLGDEAPWVVGRVSGFLKKDGHLDIQVKGLVFKNDPTLVPPD